MHLDDMAKDERREKVLPDIIDFVKGKKIIAARTAIEEFDRIIRLIAGEAEKVRAEKLKSLIEIVEDNVSDRIEALPDSARISERAKLAFGTGETYKAVTLSSNSGFIRASRQQNVFVSVFEHRPRALSEAKEPAAKIFDKNWLPSGETDYFSQLFPKLT